MIRIVSPVSGIMLLFGCYCHEAMICLLLKLRKCGLICQYQLVLTLKMKRSIENQCIHLELRRPYMRWWIYG